MLASAYFLVLNISVSFQKLVLLQVAISYCNTLHMFLHLYRQQRASINNNVWE